MMPLLTLGRPLSHPRVTVPLLPLLLLVLLGGSASAAHQQQPQHQGVFLDEEGGHLKEGSETGFGEEVPVASPPRLGLFDEEDAEDGAGDGDGRDKRAPSGFMGMRGKKAPSGFVGMRGRRGEGELYPQWGADGALEQEDNDADKRAPYGFVGMRGKKAPSGFVGMRGKKAPLGFFGMRGKKDAPQSLNDLLMALSSRYRDNYGYKRAPLGFMGMRGRRSDTSFQEGDYGGGNSDPQQEKRAPYGFVGMRG